MYRFFRFVDFQTLGNLLHQENNAISQEWMFFYAIFCSMEMDFLRRTRMMHDAHSWCDAAYSGAALSHHLHVKKLFKIQEISHNFAAICFIVVTSRYKLSSECKNRRNAVLVYSSYLAPVRWQIVLILFVIALNKIEKT